MQKNKDLASFYNRVYKKGERGHYTSLMLSGDKVPPAKAEVLKEISWKGKAVLDAGCGTGELPYLIAKKGAQRVIGVDYSEEAIAGAMRTYDRPNLKFICDDIANIKGKFDVIVTLGTIEHVDDPFSMLQQLKGMLKPRGSLIVTCPNWVNPRGYILMTLKILFDAKITLADLHHLTPVEFEEIARRLRMNLTWKTMEHEWAHGEKCIRDFERRLPNIARDSELPTNTEALLKFINWLEGHMAALERNTKYGGAVGLYHLKRIG